VSLNKAVRGTLPSSAGLLAILVLLPTVHWNAFVVLFQVLCLPVGRGWGPSVIQKVTINCVYISMEMLLAFLFKCLFNKKNVFILAITFS